MLELLEKRYLIYSLILFAKIIENTLSTIRLVVVARRRKNLGAILNGLIALLWIIGTGSVIINIEKDPWKIIFFILGSIIGSWVGSAIEERMAIVNK